MFTSSIMSSENKCTKKYRFFKNKRTQFHPSIDLGINENGEWETIDLTSHPSGYDAFVKNPNPNTPNELSFYRTRVNRYHPGQKGEELKYYSLSKEDEEKIDKIVKKYKKR